MKRITLLIVLIIGLGCNEDEYNVISFNDRAFDLPTQLSKINEIRSKHSGVFYGVSYVEMKEVYSKDNRELRQKFPLCNATIKESGLLEIEICMRIEAMEGERILIKEQEDCFKSEIRHYNNCIGGASFFPSKIIKEIVNLNKSVYEKGDTLIGEIDIEAEKITRVMTQKGMDISFKDRKVKTQFIKGEFFAIVR